MIPRRQPPVYSPVDAGAVAAGLGGLLSSETGPERIIAALRDEFGAAEVLLTDSGTSALGLAIRSAVSARPGHPVALPAFACYDLATAADAAGADVVLYDLDPATLAPDPASWRDVLALEPAAVVLVHLYGIPVPMVSLAADAARAGAIVIEDAAQAAGGRLGDRPAGAFGPLTVLSFGRGKGITGGGGGALLGFGDGAARVRDLASSLEPAAGAGKSVVALAAQWMLGRPALYGIPASLPFLGLGDTVYHPPHAARGMAPAALRVLEHTWPLRMREAVVRKANAARLLGSVGVGFNAVRVPPAAEAGYLRLPLMTSDRGRVLAPGIPLGVMPGYPIALADLPGFGERSKNRHVSFQGARALASGLLTLPTHSLLREPDLLGLERWLSSAGGRP